MKKLVIIPLVMISAGSFFMVGCDNTGSNTSMKAPLQTAANPTDQTANKETAENESIENAGKKAVVNQTAVLTAADAKATTTDNMLAAFKGETTASAKYAAYSKKAEQEGYHEIALLFKAASTAENIHANNHKAVLQEAGIAVPVITPAYAVNSTKENLQDAITGEGYEVSTMYPGFLAIASQANNQLALISLNYAYKTEKKHKVMYETALAALQSNTVKSLPVVFYICPTCGNTYETKAPARCGISMTSGEKFLKINSL